MEENDEDFNELFDLSRFIQPTTLEEILNQFENGRKPSDIKLKKNLTADEFMKQPLISDKENLKKYLEMKEKQIDEDANKDEKK